MGKLKFTKEELESKYREKLDVFLDDCDWITHVTGHMVCGLVATCLEEFKIQIIREKLYERYDKSFKMFADKFKPIINNLHGLLAAKSNVNDVI